MYTEPATIINLQRCKYCYHLKVITFLLLSLQCNENLYINKQIYRKKTSPNLIIIIIYIKFTIEHREQNNDQFVKSYLGTFHTKNLIFI